MLTIRLQRAGKKNKPEYRIVLADKTAASQKKFTEVLGSYNPHTKNLTIRSQERLDYWVKEQHVELSATVNNLLVSKEIIQGTKSKAFTIPKKEAELDASAEETASEPAAETPATEVTEESAPAEEVVAEAPVETPAEPEVVAEAEAEPATEAPADEAKTEEA